MTANAVNEISVADDVAIAHPGVRVHVVRAEVAAANAAAGAAEAGWSELHARWQGASEADLLAEPHVRAYRSLCASLGIDPDRNPPSVQAVITRALLGKPAGSWPRINPIVDIVNVVAVRTLTSLGVFDSDKLEGTVRLAMSPGRERFLPLGGTREAKTKPGQLVLRDDVRILSQLALRDSRHQAVTPGTTNVFLLGVEAPGVPRQAIADALTEVRDQLTGEPG